MRCPHKIKGKHEHMVISWKLNFIIIDQTLTLKRTQNQNIKILECLFTEVKDTITFYCFSRKYKMAFDVLESPHFHLSISKDKKAEKFVK